MAEVHINVNSIQGCEHFLGDSHAPPATERNTRSMRIANS